MQIIDAITYQPLQRLPAQTCSIEWLNWSADGNRIAGGNSDRAYAWDRASGRILFQDGLAGYGSQAQLSLDGTRLLLGAGYNAFAVTDIRTGANVFGGSGGKPEWSPDGGQIVSVENCGSEGCGNLSLWDATTGEKLQTINNPSQHMNFAIWNSNSQQFVSGISTFSPEEMHSIQIWDAERFQIIQSFPVSNNFVYQLAWRPDDQIIATVHRDEGEVRLWDVMTGEHVKLLSFPGAVFTAAWSPDGRHFAYGGQPNPQLKIEFNPGCVCLVNDTLIICETSQLLLK